MSLGFYLMEVEIQPQFVTPWWSVDFKTCRPDAPIEAVLSKSELTLESKWRRWGALLVRDRGSVVKASCFRSVIVVRAGGSVVELPDVAGALIGSFRTNEDLWHVFHHRAPERAAREANERPAPRSGAPSPVERRATAPADKAPENRSDPGETDIFSGLS